MSSHEEIMEVYLGDIVQKQRNVRGKPGWNAAMMEDLKANGMSVHRLWEGVLSADDEVLLARIADADRVAGVE